MNTDTATGLETPPPVVRDRGCPGRVRQFRERGPGLVNVTTQDERVTAPALTFPGFRYLRMPSVSMTLRYLFRFSDFR